ncbi:MAG: secretin N-terminal domain-containing protein [Phycisphaerales bacterium]
MRSIQSHRRWAASLAACAGLAVSVFAQEGAPPAEAMPAPAPAAPSSPEAPPPDAQGQPQAQPATAAPAQPDSTAQPAGDAQAPRPIDPIRFNFKDQPFDQVLDFFSRVTGLPVIREAPPPQGAMTFISAEAYSFDEALSILNLTLQVHGVRLRRDGKYLYLASLQESARKPGDVVAGTVPPDATPDQILTLTIPLNNTQAQVVADQIKPLIGPYGSVQPVPAQNMLIIVETAAQCRRIQAIVGAMDGVRPADSEYKLFALKHAQADAVFNALKGLIAEKQTMVVFDEKGNRKVLREESIQGMSLQPDPRTNSIIGVGPKARLQVAEELIALLDVPEGGRGDAQMMTFALATVTPQDAATHLNTLFKSVPDAAKPTIVPLTDAGKLTIVAPAALLAQAAALIGEIDPGSARAPASQDPGRPALPERRAAVLRLTYVTPAAIEQLAPRLLTPRQSQVVKFAPMPDGRGVVVSGPADDVAAFESIVKGLDAAPDLPKEVRQVRIASGDARVVLDRAVKLHKAAGREQTDPVSWDLDALSRTVTLIGPRAAVDRFALLLQDGEAAFTADLESRTFQLAKVKPSVLAGKLLRVARAMLQPSDGAAYIEPKLEPVDELGTLIVRAEPGQFAVLENLIRRLDQPEPGSAGFTILPVSGVKASQVRDRAMGVYMAQVAEAPGMTIPEVVADDAANALQIVGDAEATQRLTRIVGELQRLGGPAREVRLIELKIARAETVVSFVQDLIKSSESFRVRGGPDPVVEAIEATNTLLVAAEPTQFAVIEHLVRNLDAATTTERLPLRILRLRATDAANLASVLQASFDRRSIEQKAKEPVDIQADAATNTLVVSAHPGVFPEIERIVTELNETQALDAEGREIRIFPLKVARAEELARTIDSMYPEPPMPIDPRTRQPRPDLQRPREVVVRADRGTNALIVDAPAKRLAGFEQLVKSLDQQKLADNVEVRTFRVARAELASVATTLRNLAASGAIYGGGGGVAPGVATPVTIDTEPMTRTLIVSGPTQVFAAVEEVLKRLDSAPERPATGVKMHALRHARAERLQPLLLKILITRVKEQQQRDGTVAVDAQSLLDVAADPATNTLIISAPEAIQPVAEELIKALDNELADAGRAVIRIVPLTYAEAPQTAQALNQALPTVELPTGGRVTILAAGGANALMLSGAEADLKKVEELIASLDAKPLDADAQDVATYELKHADAGALAPMVQRLLTDQLATDPRVLLEQLRLRRGQLPARPPVRVEADARNNWLVVSGPQSSVQLAKAIIDRLDQPAEATGHTAMVFTPAKGDAQALAATVARLVNETLPSGRKPVELTVEPRSGGIIILGTPEQAAESVKRLAEFDDRALPSPAADLALIDLKHLDARTTAPILQGVLSDRSRWPEGLRQAERAGLSVPQPTVNADPRANRVLVSAPTTLMPLARELVASFDRPSSQGAAEVRVYRLEKGDAASAATALRTALSAGLEPGEAAPVVTPEPSSNTIVVAATPARLVQADTLIASMDEAARPEGLGVRTIYLKFVRAETIAPVLEGVLKRESIINLLAPWQVGQYLAQGGKAGDDVRVAAEKRLNAVVVSAPLPILEMAEQVIRELDTDPGSRGGPRTDRPVRIISLTNSDAGELAANLASVFADDQAGEEPPTIRVDKASNSLIVRASDVQMATIGELARKLDTATLTSSRQMRFIPIDRSRADADAVARTLQRLLEQQGGVKVEVISAEDLLKPADPADPNAKPRGDAGRDTMGGRFDLLRAAVLSAAIAHQPVQPGTPAPSSPPAPAPAPFGDVELPGVTIAVDPATNSLIVLGSPRITDRLAALASMLEQQMPPEATRVRIVTLPESADAQAVAAVVRQTAEQIGRAGPQNPGGFTGPVVAQPDPAGGALIVWANDTDFAAIGQLIGSLAAADPGATLTVKVYPLASVSASRAIESIRDLIGAEPRGQQARRVRRALDLTIQDRDGSSTRATIDPARVRMTANPGGTAVIVAAPADAFPLIDRFLATMDQSPLTERLAIRRYELKNAKADDLARTLQRLFEAQRQGPNTEDLPRTQFVADDRTNSILVTAANAQHADVQRLLETMDLELTEPDLKVEVLTLRNAAPSTVKAVVEQVVVGRDPAKRERVQISAEDGSNLFVVRATQEQIDEIKTIVAQMDSADAPALPMRTLKLLHADAQAVAAGLQRFFQQRAEAASRPGRRVPNRVAIIGDRRSGTLVVTANDEDFAQMQSLVATFDQPVASKELQLRVIQLQHARVPELRETLENISWQLRSDRSDGLGFFFFGFGGRPQRDEGDPAEDKLYVDTNERTNSVIILGQGPTLERMEAIVKALDVPVSQLADTIVRAVPVGGADPAAIARAIREATRATGLPWWQDRDPEAVIVEPDARRRMVILIGKRPKVEAAVAMVQELATATGRPGQVIESFPLRHARADRAGESLRRFFDERARAAGLPADQVSVIGSDDGNVLIVAADAESLAILRDLLAQIDQPELGKDRRREVYTLKDRKADEVANVLRQQFPSRDRTDAAVIVTPMPSTNSLIVSAPQEDFDQVASLVKQLDTTTMGDVKIVTVNLKTARASEVGEALRNALPPTVNVKVTPLARSNTVILTGSDEAITLAMEQIGNIDAEPERTLVEFQRFKLKNAIASDVAFTLREMLRSRPRGPADAQPSVDYGLTDNTISVSGSAEQVRDIAKMIDQLDVKAEEQRTTEFVKLQFADAQQTARALDVFYGRFAAEANTPGARNVTIVPDQASNSLVIGADAAEWEGIRALLKKLDTEEYDTSRQLTVLPLRHADAAGVARALNEGFRAPMEQRAQREQLRQQQNQRGGAAPQRLGEQAAPPPMLVDSEGAPSVSAETQTNSLIVFAGRRDLQRIEALVAQIDVPDFNRFPAARVIPLESGKASSIAAAVRELFQSQQTRPNGPRSVAIVGDDASNALIVRAEDREFAEIKALTDTIQQQGDRSRATVRVLALRNVPAARLQKTLTQTFSASAKQLGETLAVEVDRTSNALVVASSERLYQEIEKVARELDGVVPGGEGQPGVGPRGPLGQSVFIIDVQNNTPEQVRKMLEDMGLTRPQGEDRPGVVSEPISIVPLTSRRALAVVAGPQDGEAVVALVRALDAEPAHAEQQVSVVALKLATASAVVTTLTEMLDPKKAASPTAPAAAIAEQVRRLSLARNGLEQADMVLDLSRPIRLIADPQTNAVIIGSTKENVTALREVVRMLDALPIGEAVVVRIFPLNNASATRAKAAIDDLFKQGESLRRIPGTQRQGLPTTATGKALAGDIAITVDDRTNTLIAAGREEAVAFVEVILKDLDSAESSKWVEPTLVTLKFADARALAESLRAVLVQGLATTPEAIGLQKQFGRLRMVREGKDLADPAARIEADLFAPFTGLVIQAEEQLNALIVVGSPANIAIVRELAGMLDVEAASASNTVRVFPLQFAAADRVAAIVGRLFDQRQTLPGARDEDKLILAPDARTNALIVSTSPRSFAILEATLRTLDNRESNPMVGVHVVPVVGADAATIAPKIQSLMRERIEAARIQGNVRDATEAFTIEADKPGNLLIVACSDENLAVVKELVAALAAGNPALEGSRRTEIVQLKTGKVTDVAASVRNLYVEKETAKRGEDALTVVANERLNALVVTGTEQDVRAIRDLVDRFDSAQVTNVQSIRFIELKSANALEVVNLLQNVFSGRSVAGAGGIGVRQATRLSFIREQVAGELQGQLGAKPTEAQVDAAIRETISLTPDLRTNRVVASAPPEMMALIAEMIEDLDSTKRDRRIEKFELKNADSRAMAELLRDVFNLRQQGNLYVLVPSDTPEPGEEGAAAPAPGDQKFTPVPDERQQLSIAIDARTNTIIVSGTEAYLAEVGKLVRELDGVQGAERERLIYPLRNAKAKEVETTLASSFKQEADLQRDLLGGELSGAVMRQMEQEVTVVGDEKSNKLIVTVSPRYTEKVLALIEELDSAPPQVVIQVLLAEVTVDNSDAWGADIRLKNLGGDNFNFASLAAGAGVASALGVPHLSFSSVDFELLVRALEAQGKLQVLSRPSVTVNNNEAASINVGEEIAIVTSVDRAGDTGRTTANVERRELGIILNVTPTISADGFVRMELAPEISSLSARTTQISEDFSAPVITQRKMSTTVTIKDGQTVVIGGLIQSTEEQRKTKVPVVGDFPLVGWLFRSTDARDVKTELVIVLTPKVIYNDTPDGSRRLRDLSEKKIDSLQNPRELRETLRQDGAYEEQEKDGEGMLTSPAPAEPPVPVASPGGGGGPTAGVPDAPSVDDRPRPAVSRWPTKPGAPD